VFLFGLEFDPREHPVNPRNLDDRIHRDKDGYKSKEEDEEVRKRRLRILTPVSNSASVPVLVVKHVSS